jgi:hypothetical protein
MSLELLWPVFMFGLLLCVIIVEARKPKTQPRSKLEIDKASATNPLVKSSSLDITERLNHERRERYRRVHKAGVSKDMIKGCHMIVDAYAELIQYGSLSSEVRDEIELPFPKSTIKTSLAVKMALEADPKRREALMGIAVLLPQFQPNVGNVPIWPNGIDTGKMHDFMKASQVAGIEVRDTDLLQLLRNSKSDSQRHLIMQPIVEAELQVIIIMMSEMAECVEELAA